MLNHIVWLTSAGGSHTSYKVCVICVMGSSIVRVDSPQRITDGQKGGKLPGMPSSRRSRGSRGRRAGRARAGKARCLARRAARESAKSTVPRGTHAGRLQKARIKRGKWIESRFSALERNLDLGQSGDLREVIRGDNVVLGRRDREVKTSKFWSKYRKLCLVFRQKRLPAPPFARRGSRVDVWGWFRKYFEMKHGTWDDVSWLNPKTHLVGPLGRLDDGEHNYPKGAVVRPVAVSQPLRPDAEPFVPATPLTALIRPTENNRYADMRPTADIIAAAHAARSRRLNRSARGVTNRGRKARHVVERSRDDFSPAE